MLKHIIHADVNQYKALSITLKNNYYIELTKMDRPMSWVLVLWIVFVHNSVLDIDGNNYFLQ